MKLLWPGEDIFEILLLFQAYLTVYNFADLKVFHQSYRALLIILPSRMIAGKTFVVLLLMMMMMLKIMMMSMMMILLLIMMLMMKTPMLLMLM